MSFAEKMKEDRRLCILRLLHEQPEYTLNHSVLKLGLGELAHHISEDVVLSEIAWLAEQGLVTAKTLENNLRIVKLTQRGSDAATGSATVPGVKRPSPGRG
ncbi:hypothetical protein [Emcibacter sp.]|uniref:VpaChn25_0724 family phage protein n=1 Tax=Emcibacter sp. TaxID=1979954 RepID=UPI002AA66DC2|nr:hypothetical protein [Emcibacter sp.]